MQGVEGARDGMFRYDWVPLKPESLVQIFIGIKIKDENPDLDIRFEVKTKYFKRDCFDINDQLDPNSSFYNNKINRKGFIDIGVYKDGGAYSLVEVKLVNPSVQGVEKDIDRLIDYVKLGGSVKHGYFVYVYSPKYYVSYCQSDTDCEVGVILIEKIIKEKNKNIEDLVFTLERRTIGEYVSFDGSQDLSGLDDSDIMDGIRDNIYYEGVVLCVSKKILIE